MSLNSDQLREVRRMRWDEDLFQMDTLIIDRITCYLRRELRRASPILLAVIRRDPVWWETLCLRSEDLMPIFQHGGYGESYLNVPASRVNKPVLRLQVALIERALLGT